MTVWLFSPDYAIDIIHWSLSMKQMSMTSCLNEESYYSTSILTEKCTLFLVCKSTEVTFSTEIVTLSIQMETEPSQWHFDGDVTLCPVYIEVGYSTLSWWPHCWCLWPFCSVFVAFQADSVWELLWGCLFLCPCPFCFSVTLTDMCDSFIIDPDLFWCWWSSDGMEAGGWYSLYFLSCSAVQ